MGKLSDKQIQAWIRSGEHFEGRSDGNGLGLRFPQKYKTPSWRFRYSIGGKARFMDLGSYGSISLKKAREISRQLAAKIALGIDPKLEKADLIKQTHARIQTDRNTVASLANDYFQKRTHKTVYIEKNQYAKNVAPIIGKLSVKDVNASHVVDILEKIKSRGAPTVANKVLRLMTKIFNHGIKLQWLDFNPWGAFDLSDAGGSEKPRDRWLNKEELTKLFSAMNTAKGWSTQNDHAVRLLLILAVRKMELIGAKIDEFDLDAMIWHYSPQETSNKKRNIDIPLPTQAVDLLKQLIWLAGDSEYLLPARKSQVRMLPHISPDTINSAIKRFLNVDIPSFTIHDLRRTARTHIESLGFNHRTGEKILNHKIKGVEGVYNQYDYFAERKEALQEWADFLSTLENTTN